MRAFWCFSSSQDGLQKDKLESVRFSLLPLRYISGLITNNLPTKLIQLNQTQCSFLQCNVHVSREQFWMLISSLPHPHLKRKKRPKKMFVIKDHPAEVNEKLRSCWNIEDKFVLCLVLSWAASLLWSEKADSTKDPGVPSALSWNVSAMDISPPQL